MDTTTSAHGMLSPCRLVAETETLVKQHSGQETESFGRLAATLDRMKAVILSQGRVAILESVTSCSAIDETDRFETTSGSFSPLPVAALLPKPRVMTPLSVSLET